MATNSQLAFVFPGQGSQQIGMLADIVEKWPASSATFAEASDALGYDLWKLIQSGTQEELNLTENSQPALLACSVAIWRIFCAETSVRPALLSGHSLGEWSALVAGGVLDFQDAIRLVRLRGRYMQEAVPVGVGSMAAIIGLADEEIERCCNEAQESQVVSAVNYNSPGQVVIAGHVDAVNRAIELCKAAGAKRALPLPVSAPFHTSLMRPAAERLASHLAETTFNAPAIPVVHNVTAKTEQDPAIIRNLMVEQIYSPVGWVACVNSLKASGVTSVVECGPGKVLSGLVKRIDKELSTDSTDSVDALTQVIQKLS
ncbi:[acyl-carrier-protein] S-malonyltransferase [Saccharophagus sp. K07]|jgi:[acyl-carrier-protein] S-malonyltransferase|uniref:ACP S-malonyltransferase n=1 Tax=Saccharophagus sp. K07 TaxID=2283636 RepID=UPI001651D99D|nr:ACP S-malonyltransferase [Saccharophagus sp. K07]MBC6904874.1 [acyl-carrier-protein] S-malonyltransferase [Saccharophagus sp. K07]